MAEWLKALVSKTGIPFTGYRGFESPFFRWISTPSVMIIKHLGFFICKKVAPKMHGVSRSKCPFVLPWYSSIELLKSDMNETAFELVFR